MILKSTLKFISGFVPGIIIASGISSIITGAFNSYINSDTSIGFVLAIMGIITIGAGFGCYNLFQGEK